MYHADSFRIPIEAERGKDYFNAESNSRFPGGLVWKPKQKSKWIISDLFTRIMDLPYGYFCQVVKNS